MTMTLPQIERRLKTAGDQLVNGLIGLDEYMHEIAVVREALDALPSAAPRRAKPKPQPKQMRYDNVIDMESRGYRRGA